MFIAAAFTTLTIAYVSDKLKHRASLVLTSCFISIVGYIILLNQEHVSINARYGALYLIASGSFAALPGMWILLLNNISGSYKTAFAMGMEIGLGNGGWIHCIAFFPGESGSILLDRLQNHIFTNVHGDRLRLPLRSWTLV